MLANDRFLGKEGSTGMKSFRAIAAALTTAALFPIASLAGASGAQAATPATSPVLCTSPAVWLRLFTATGERCYTGTGTEIVSLPQVREMQVVGKHDVCLSLMPARTNECVIGPGTLFFVPPAYVRTANIIQ
jgi:hypothetical protein